MSVPTTRTLDPIFGSPILRAGGSGTATWAKVNTSSQWQRGTGWQACLTGGAQTGDDWGAMFFPVLEQRVTDFTAAQWSYYMTATQTMGVNLVIWVHNPENLNQRAEITQIGGVSGLGKTLGWNSHKLVKTTDQFVWYGEDWSAGSAAALTGSGLTSGTQYGWDDFQADVLFNKWHIYRVSLESGWDASGTFQSVWVVEAKFNGLSVPFIPSLAEIFAADTPLAKLAANSGVDIGDVTLNAGTAEIGKLAAGTALIGKVGIDQSTASANEVVVKSGTVTTVSTVTSITAIAGALPSGTNLIGKVGIDQTTLGTTNGVVRVKGGLSNSGVKSADALIKNGAGAVYWLTVSDTAALAIELANAVTNTGPDMWAIDLPAGGYAHFIFDPPIEFDTGIYLDVSTATCKITIGYL